MLNNKCYWEPNRAYREIDKLSKYAFFDGYWQSYRYVDEILDSLKMDFIPKNELSEKTKSVLNNIEKQDSVFVGIRRGDYLNDVKHCGLFSNNYYLSAMDEISKRVNNPVFYIFSNDIEWCKENITWGNRKVVFREVEDQTDDFEELMLMASCKHAVIINSTFHWWGAYLIKNPDKIIICPDKWFFDDKPIDIIPPKWIRIRDNSFRRVT
jgi:hypothetical protein